MNTKFGISLYLYEKYTPDCPVKNYELIFVLEGYIKLVVDDDEILLQKDDVFIVNAGQSYSLEKSPRTLFCLISISKDVIHNEMSGRNVSFACNSSGPGGNERCYERLKRIIGSLLIEYSADISSFNLRKRALFLQLLDQILNHFILQKPGILSSSSDDGTISDVLFYIQNHFREHISLNTIAALFFMNPTSFSRFFKKKTGINFLEYLIRIRLENAAEELVSTEKSIIAVSLDNGFTNSSMFSKAFKKAYGMSPTEYKKTYRPNEIVYDTIISDQHNECYQERLSSLVRVNSGHVNSDIFRYKVIINTEKTLSCRKVWNQCINFGSAFSLLGAKMQENVCIISREYGIKYARINNIFSWEMRMRKDRSSRKFNYDLIDNVLDFLLSNGMKPFFDTAQKPGRVIVNSTNIIELERRDSVFETLEECIRVVQGFMTHIVQKYGVREVETWIFDLSVNPGTRVNIKYWEMFDSLAEIIKSNAPGAKVGGGCIGSSFLDSNIIKEWSEKHHRPDFISIACFPYLPPAYQSDSIERSAAKFSSDAHSMYHEILRIKDVLKEYGFERIPLIISEWNLSFSDRNYYNDSCGKAAQMLMNMTECLQEIEMAAYMYATDRSTINYDIDALLFGGTGLLSKDGLKKPAFYALQFMNKLGAKLVDYGDRYIVTSDDPDTYIILIFNYKLHNYRFYLKQENKVRIDELEGLYEDNDPLEMTVELTGIPNGQYVIKTENLGISNGSLLSSWRDLNYEKNLTPDEYHYLEKISIPHITLRTQYTDNDRLAITETLAAHDIRKIYVHRLK